MVKGFHAQSMHLAQFGSQFGSDAALYKSLQIPILGALCLPTIMQFLYYTMLLRMSCCNAGTSAIVVHSAPSVRFFSTIFPPTCQLCVNRLPSTSAIYAHISYTLRSSFNTELFGTLVFPKSIFKAVAFDNTAMLAIISYSARMVEGYTYSLQK